MKFLQTPAAQEETGVRRPPDRIDINKLIADMPPPDEPPTPPLAVSEDPLQMEPATFGPTGVRPLPIATPLEPRLPAPEARLTPRPEFAVLAPPRPGVQARPTPVPLSALTPKVSPQFTELIEQGKLLRNSGDTAGALVKFREAATLEPANAQAMAEQAYTFEKMSLYDKAAEQWKRVLSLGENAGVLYSAARSKLDMAMAQAVRDTSSSGGNRSINAGRVLGWGPVTIQDDPDPAAAKKFVLRVPIRVRAGEKVQNKHMVAVVLFYDRLNGKDVAQTTANTNYGWANPPADFAEGDSEMLEVFYEMPGGAGAENREYYGYTARLYYQNQLQDSLAEPAALNQLFPADLTLPE
jgi:tetratricopeptide (TPR) repeat protein